MRNVIRSVLLVALPALVSVGGGAMSGVTAEAAPPFHCNQVNMHPGSLGNGQINVAYASTMWLTPANVAIPVSVFGVVAGSLPPGLTLVAGPNTNQVTLQGTPTTTGTYTFTVEIGGTYVLGTICKVSQTYTVTIL